MDSFYVHLGWFVNEFKNRGENIQTNAVIKSVGINKYWTHDEKRVSHFLGNEPKTRDKTLN